MAAACPGPFARSSSSSGGYCLHLRLLGLCCDFSQNRCCFRSPFSFAHLEASPPRRIVPLSWPSPGLRGGVLRQFQQVWIRSLRGPLPLGVADDVRFVCADTGKPKAGHRAWGVDPVVSRRHHRVRRKGVVLPRIIYRKSVGPIGRNTLAMDPTRWLSVPSCLFTTRGRGPIGRNTLAMDLTRRLRRFCTHARAWVVSVGWFSVYPVLVFLFCMLPPQPRSLEAFSSLGR